MPAEYVSRGLHIGVTSSEMSQLAFRERLKSAGEKAFARWEGLHEVVDVYARRSVRQMRALCRALGIESEEPIQDGEATRDGVERAFRKAIDEIGAEGLLVVSFAGHGIYVEDRDNDERDGCDVAWVLSGGELLDDELKGWLRDVPRGRNVIVVSDCCHAGGMGFLKGPASSLVGIQELSPLVECRWNPTAQPPPPPPLDHVHIGSVEKRSVWTPTADARTFAEVLADTLLSPSMAPTYRELESRLNRISVPTRRHVIECKPEQVWDLRPFTRLVAR